MSRRELTAPAIIGREEVHRLMEAGARVVEVLPPDAYAEAHLPGAINLPLAELDRRAPSELPRDRTVVVYCHEGPSIGPERLFPTLPTALDAFEHRRRG